MADGRNHEMDIVWTIVIGFVVGAVARLLKPGPDAMGFIFTTLIGIGGALLASWALPKLGFYQPSGSANFIASVLGAIVLLVGLSLVRSRG